LTLAGFLLYTVIKRLYNVEAALSNIVLNTSHFKHWCFDQIV